METATTTQTEQTQYLTFHVAGEEHAIGILRVTEIIEYTTMTKVPGAPAWIRGVINLRGRVVPVVDLAVKFGLPETVITNRTCIVIVEIALDGEQTVMGIMTDSVNQVVDFPSGSIEEPPPFGTKMKVEYLRGVGKTGSKFALILDIDKVLSAREILAATETVNDAMEVMNTEAEDLSPLPNQS